MGSTSLWAAIVFLLSSAHIGAFNLRRHASAPLNTSALESNVSKTAQALHAQSSNKSGAYPPVCPADVSEKSNYFTQTEWPDQTHTVCRMADCYTPKPRIERLQSLRGLLKITKKLLNDKKVPYALYSGSAIGQERCRDVLPHDTDCDVAIWQEDAHKISEGDLDSQYTVMHTREFASSPHHGGAGPYAIPFVVVDRKTGLYCDIFFMTTKPSTDRVGIAWPLATDVCPGQEWPAKYPFPDGVKKCNLFPKSAIVPFVPCVLDGVEHQCFADQKTYLKLEYGPDVMTPNVVHAPSAGKKSSASVTQF